MAGCSQETADPGAGGRASASATEGERPPGEPGLPRRSLSHSGSTGGDARHSIEATGMAAITLTGLLDGCDTGGPEDRSRSRPIASASPRPLMLTLRLDEAHEQPSRQIPRALLLAYGFLFLLTAVYWTIYLARQPSFAAYAYRTDFLGIYVGARSLATGHGAQLYDLGQQRLQMDQAVQPYHRGNLMAFIYPAYVAVLLRPIGALSFGHAVVVLLALNSLIALWIAWLLATRFLRSSRDRIALLLAYFAFVPLQLTLLQSQFGLLPALGVLQAILALRAQRHARAGCWLLVGLLKPQLILFPLFALLLWRCWSALLSFLAGLAAVLGLSFATVGWWIPTYLAFLRAYNRGGAGVSLFPIAMQNWRGLAYAIFRNESSPAFLTFLVTLTVLSLAAVVLVCRRVTLRGAEPSPARLSWEPRFAVAVLLGILSSPHLYMHDWIVFVPAGILMWLWVGEQRAPGDGVWRGFRVLLAASPFVVWFGQFVLGPASGFVQVVPCWMGLLATTACVSIVRGSAVSGVQSN